jgi:hypothetical protein
VFAVTMMSLIVFLSPAISAWKRQLVRWTGSNSEASARCECHNMRSQGTCFEPSRSSNKLRCNLEFNDRQRRAAPVCSNLLKFGRGTFFLFWRRFIRSIESLSSVCVFFLSKLLNKNMVPDRPTRTSFPRPLPTPCRGVKQDGACWLVRLRA